MFTKEKLGQRIKYLRKKQKVTQEKLAEMINVDCGYISKLEVGQNFPSLQTLNNIAIALNLDISEFFTNYELDELDLKSEIQKSLTNMTKEQQTMLYNILKSINLYNVV